ncbi:hypothetical protein Tco_0690583, partial [Tanacetum coccineum]
MPLSNSFASVLKSAPTKSQPVVDPSPALVLDESCFLDNDMSGTLMGKIKDINALPNLFSLLEKEGFDSVNISYLGGFWVLIDTGSSKSKDNMLTHKGVLSWFSELVPADDSFVSDERLVWISVEGLPSKAWSHNSFSKIIAPWGSLSEVGEDDDPSLPYKKLCVITKPNISIDYKSKVIIKGRVYWVRIKELELWSPDFSNYLSDTDSDRDVSVDENLNHGNGNNDLNCDNVEESVPDHVSESSFVNGFDATASENQATKNLSNSKDDKKSSEDPFGIYDILNRKTACCDSKSDDPLYPPCFTPDVNHLYSKVDNIDQPSSGSILDVMKSVVEIGQTMGYNMDGCLKNIQSIIGDQGDFQ